jgi:hypothetical protein
MAWANASLDTTPLLLTSKNLNALTRLVDVAVAFCSSFDLSLFSNLFNIDTLLGESSYIK